MNYKNEELFHGKGIRINGILVLSPREAYPLLKKDAVLIDLRKAYETNYRLFDVPDVIYISENEVKNNPEQLPGTKPLILADNVGMVSKNLAMVLKSKGFDNIAMISGGIIAWVRDGLPVKKDPNYELRGQCSCKLKPSNPKAPKILLK